MHEAVRIIKDEHCAFAAVLHGLRHVAQESCEGAKLPDFRVLHAMLDYIAAFPEALHHIKEEHYLFSVIRERSSAADELLDQLEAEHVRGGVLIKYLQEALMRYEAGGAAMAPAFHQAVIEFADFHWAHMRREEEVVLPLAEKVLTETDWHDIAMAFRENDTPLFGVRPKEQLERLFQRVVNVTPPPIGVGPVTLKAG